MTDKRVRVNGTRPRSSHIGKSLYGVGGGGGCSLFNYYIYHISVIFVLTVLAISNLKCFVLKFMLKNNSSLQV